MRTIRTIVIAFIIAAAVGTSANARGGGHGGGHSSSHASSSSHVNGSSHYVRGYTRRDGTHVSGYHASDPNSTRNDNYSTRGNVNPSTGTEGTKPRDGEAPH